MFSIIIPLFNKSQYISRAIDSVLDQSFSEYEVIVVNDGSSDGGGKIVQTKYGKRVVYLEQENQGVSAARNLGICAASNPYIAFLDSDDYWHRDYLYAMAKAIQTEKEVGIIGAFYTSKEFEEFSVSPNVRRIDDYFGEAIHNTFFSSSSTVIRKDFFDNNHGFKTHLKIGEDLDVWFRAAAYFGKAFLIEQKLVYYDLTGSDSKYIFKALDHSILNELMRPDFFVGMDSDGRLSDFKKKFILFNLFQYYSEKRNRSLINAAVDYFGWSFPFISSFYHLPYPILQYALGLNSFRRLFRNYMKFCFRYIYKD